MYENAQNVINAYSAGTVHQHWGLKTGDLYDHELALIQSYCSDHNAAILTLGCGAGRETFALYKLGFRNVRGADCTNALLQIAKKRSKKEGFNIEFEVASADKLPYPPGTFDIVTLFENIYGHITPHSARIDSLTEIKRVLKPGGLVIIVVNSIFHKWRYYAAFKILDVFRMLYNPNGMERGDKFWGLQRKINPQNKTNVKIHWFIPEDLWEDARKTGLSVLQTTTRKGVIKNPQADSTKLHGQGWLICVLQRPK